MRLSTDELDELRQQLRIRLLTGPEPRIALYSGRGPLAAWIRVSAVRLALNLKSQHAIKKFADADVLADLVSEYLGPDVSAIKSLYQSSLRAALDRAIRNLERRDKTLLRLHFLDQLNIEAIGKIYHVHRATVARWLVAIRKRVLSELQQELATEIRVTSSEFRSLVAVVEADLSLSLQRLLG